jgi:hypothetical protein
VKRPRISLPDLARRITGFSTPIFGVSWNPPPAERDTVRSFLTFLEDRRVLFHPYTLEVESDAARSVQAIRQSCTGALAALDDQSQAIGAIRAIRAACRRFSDEPRADFRNLCGSLRHFDDRAGFFTALGDWRAAVGAQLAILAVLYQIELEAELASIIPAEDQEGNR